MPYIKREDRGMINHDLHELVDTIIWAQPDILARPGMVNYAVSRLVCGTLKPTTGWSYHSLSRAIAVLRDAATEMERRLMAKREDQVIKDNGDLEDYI